ncbi:MAG: hypothetical protein M3Y17_02385 [Actinomycetota bacterium]|nr:hypothetical protein [Actinomycetota bacterium]
MRLIRGIALIGASCALTGCGTSQHDQVQAKVMQFSTATAARDYQTICDQVLAPALLAHVAPPAGIGCVQALRIYLGSVQSPTLSIGRISISGDHASVIALTGARGQQASLDAIELLQTSHGWRISSLGSPLKAATRGKAG